MEVASFVLRIQRRKTQKGKDPRLSRSLKTSETPKILFREKKEKTSPKRILSPPVDNSCILLLLLFFACG